MRDAVRESLGGVERERLTALLTAYRLCSRIEYDLKGTIIARLKTEYGDGSWWAVGVPREVRKRCAEMREDEDCCIEVEGYLYLIQLRKILQSQWRLFAHSMERATGADGRKKALAWIDEINPIRNVVMHPGKRDIVEADLERLEVGRSIVRRFLEHIEV